MNPLGLVARAEAAFACGDLDQALADIEAAASALGDDAPPAVAARLSWLVATIALASGDGEAFADAALAALEVAPDGMVDELTAALRRVTAATAASSPLAAIGARFGLDARDLAAVAMLHRPGRVAVPVTPRLVAEHLVVGRGGALVLAPSVAAFLDGRDDPRLGGAGEAPVPAPFGATGALVIVEGSHDVAAELTLACGRRWMAIDAGDPVERALDAARDTRLRDAVLVIRGVPAWLGAVAPAAGLLLVIAPSRSAGRALAALRSSRGAVDAWRDPADVARPRLWLALPDALAALIARDDTGIAVERAGETGRAAALTGEAEAIARAADAVGARAGLRCLAVDVGAEGLATARDALAGRGVVLILGAAGLDPVGAAALAAALRASSAITLLAAAEDALPPALRAACETIVAVD